MRFCLIVAHVTLQGHALCRSKQRRAFYIHYFIQYSRCYMHHLTTCLAFTVQKAITEHFIIGCTCRTGFPGPLSIYPTSSLGDLPSLFKRLSLTGCWVQGISTLHFTCTQPRPKTAAREEDCNWLADLLASSTLLDAWSIHLSSNTWGSSSFFTNPLSHYMQHRKSDISLTFWWDFCSVALQIDLWDSWIRFQCPQHPTHDTSYASVIPQTYHVLLCLATCNPSLQDI